MKITYVVGEMFSNCDQLDNFMCFKNWYQLHSEKHIEDVVFLPGQGLTLPQRNLITATCKKDYARILINDLPMARKSLSHKQNHINTLITEPVKVNDNVYISDLIIQHNNELTLDHTTGIHIQGMIFLEATRQMASAVTELYMAKEKQSFAINNIYADYMSFAFPVETKISLTISKTEKDSEYVVELSFFQSDKLVVKTGGRFTSVDKDELSKKEMRLANLFMTKHNKTQNKTINKFIINNEESTEITI
ncbi:AfsA-related hotdog domain-containing protein [Tolumonas lignilytica]|uniref:AfsA-related hotdog domain-containing protein n=1 Tax=Tolumonas lignilytica TaxID=1283284 RepID=UPI0004635AC1|nr:AfsA-related hotdog domain-containing protein [Tolumonas lignilytica]